MAGSLTIGGLAAGIPSGEKILGPITLAGSNTIGTVEDRELVTGDNTFEVPKGAAAVLVAFPFVSEAPEVKIRTNLDPLDSGLPVLGTGFAAWAIPPGVTSLILHSSGSTGLVELSFI
jgi:hypothetical protein